MESLFKRVYKEKDRAQEAESTAITALQTQKRFVANISHEVRTPLNGLIGSLHLLRESNLNEESNKFLSTAINSSENLKGLLNDILDISDIESGNNKIKSVDFKLHDLVENVTTLFEAKAESKKIKLTFSIDPQIPNDLIGDSIKINQVLSNLLSNAIKFTHTKGSVHLEVINNYPETITNRNDINLSFIVSDNGIGIEKKNQDHIFEAFRQEDISQNRKFDGAGLGLTIVAGFVKIMDGKIKIDSEPGFGTTFTITLPLKIGEKTAERALEQTPINLTDELKETQILIVEDNSANRLIAKGFLKKLGITPDISVNGKEAVEAVRVKQYDLIFMDIQMPVMNGIDATIEIIKEHGDNAPTIVALTANAFNEEREHCIEAGMKDLISKAFTKNDLKDAIEKYISPNKAA